MAKIANSNTIKLLLGLGISALFLYLAFGKIDTDKMLASFGEANAWYFIPATLAIFIAHWLRAVRWQYFLDSVKRVPVIQLFKAVLIGYMGNTVLPAHLGEVFRANVIGNREKVATSSVLATVVIERLIDVLSLLVIMVATLIIYPFPEWVTRSGYIMFGLTIALFVCLYLLKRQNKLIVALMEFGLKLLPKGLSAKIEEIINAFVDGINGIQRKRDYLIVLLQSISIWFFYWLSLHLIFLAFDLYNTYDLTTISSVVLLVITTISVVVPSSPGYVGTYHYLCQLSLELFGVPGAVGLSYAFAAHGISVIPTAIVGFFVAWKVGVDRLKSDTLSN